MELFVFLFVGIAVIAWAFSIPELLILMAKEFFYSMSDKPKVALKTPIKHAFPMNNFHFIQFCDEFGIKEDEREKWASFFFTYPCQMLPVDDPQFEMVEAHRRKAQMEASGLKPINQKKKD